MKCMNFCGLLILCISYQEILLKSIPDSLVIPKLLNQKNIPLNSVPEKSNIEEEPKLKVSPKINLPAKNFTLIEHYKVIPNLYIDKKDSGYDGISLIAEALKSDLARVIGAKVDNEGKASESEDGLKIITEKSKLDGKAIIAGTYGENGNEIINDLIEKGSIDISDLENRWECYLMQVVRKPLSGLDEALVIVGTDKRGTIYGLFHISEMAGISPWVWWADILPEKKSSIILPGEQCNLISKEPSIKYRGIFLNDESPSLTTWTKKR